MISTVLERDPPSLCTVTSESIHKPFPERLFFTSRCQLERKIKVQCITYDNLVPYATLAALEYNDSRHFAV